MSGVLTDAEACIALEIAVSEALNNIVEHAYAGRPPGVISISLLHTAPDLVVDILDGGAAFPGGVLPEGRPVDVSGAHETLPEGGFGWHLIRSLTAHLEYTRTDNRNHLRLSFDFTSHP
ncbi:MAG: ATP-binding protein [Rhodobacteraceae bacterium]|nr:ATP-binding protein [Paracoccaceae bacterium]